MPGKGYILRLCQRSREIELRPTVDLYLRTGFTGLARCFVVQLHASRQLKSNGLQFIRIKGDDLGSLTAALHVGLQGILRKCHIHVRNIRHVLTVIIKIHCQLLTGLIGTGKCIRASVSIGCRHMRNDKAFPGREIRMLLSKETFITRRLCAIVADLCQSFPVLQFCDRKCPVAG